MLLINNITKIFPTEDKQNGEFMIETQGTNLIDILSMEGIDIAKTFSDDMWDVYNVLGIEAARTLLIQEFTKVASFDGTYINPRHIQLLVDYICHTGTMTAISRHGITRDVGPIANSSFETPIDNLTHSSVFNEIDDMKSIASNIMFGKEGSFGSNSSEMIKI